MPEYTIAGIEVKFPFEPYEVQRAFMEKVIMCLNEGSNGVLESPTGTGKTLSLLCSSLAWLQAKKQEINSERGRIFKEPEMSNNKKLKLLTPLIVPTIIYASRTHSQLAQAVRDLKRTSYSSMKAVVLGSRNQLCINPEVMVETESANKIQKCKLRTRPRKSLKEKRPICPFHCTNEFNKSVNYVHHFRPSSSTIWDIEDLVQQGEKLQMCPYYAAKDLANEADIVFMPYQYLFDHTARRTNEIQISKAICILDEAHNIGKICEESASVHIKTSDIEMAIEDTEQILKAIISEKTENYTTVIERDVVKLKEMLIQLANAIDQIQVKPKEGATFPATYMFQLLAKANITFSTADGVKIVLDTLLEYLNSEETEKNKSLHKSSNRFQKLTQLFNCVFNCGEQRLDKVERSFKVHVQIEEPKSNANAKITKMVKRVSFWCFNPGFGMEQLLNLNPRSVILTSGTLAPLKPLIAELDLKVGHQLQNPHIINASQVFCKIIGYGPDRDELISNYQNRDNLKYRNSLGLTILNVVRIVPDGILVFFPSYTLLHQCVNSWRASDIWTHISRYKPIFIESRGKDDFIASMNSYYKSISESKGACFLAVCRGKVSEGLDFIDRNGRAVIIIGLPYPPFKDKKIILKRKYLDENRTKENELLTGSDWYSLEATRAVNQAIGRVIRHRYDYGAILLCDSRFHQPHQVCQLPKWLHEILGTTLETSAFGPVIRDLKNFFRNAEKMLPMPPESSPKDYTLTADDDNLSSFIDFTCRTDCDDFDVENSSVFPLGSGYSSEDVVVLEQTRS